jgi:hypothetical protein
MVACRGTSAEEVIVGRGRLGQVLVTAGAVALLFALVAIGASHELRDTASVHDAAPELLQIDSVRTAVTAELGRAIQAMYAPLPIDAATLAVATERIVSNGYVVDDFQQALDRAHRAWLYGAPMVVELDPAVVTQASVTGLRDADLDVAAAFPAGGVVRPGPIELPVNRSASSLGDLGMLALAGALISLVMIGFGAVLDPVRQRTMKTLARGMCVAGLVLVLGALVMPLPVVGDLHDLVAVLGALSAQKVASQLVLAGVFVFVGLSLHASADRLVAEVTRQVARARAPRAAKPVRSGAKVSKRGTERRRSEAIDAFFGDSKASEGKRPEQIVLEEGPDELLEPLPAGAPSDTEGAEELTLEDERAAALAAERREALERIDGTRSRYRTHLKR